MHRLLLITALLAIGCTEPPQGFQSFRVGESVKVKATGQQGQVISSYPSTRKANQSEYMVMFEVEKPKRGVKYTTAGYLYDELEEVKDEW